MKGLGDLCAVKLYPAMHVKSSKELREYKDLNFKLFAVCNQLVPSSFNQKAQLFLKYTK